MTSASLARLIELVPPPAHATHRTGDRDLARAAVGWNVPDHVFEVVETYGDIAWMGWMLQSSPFSPDGARSLTDRLYDLEQVAPGKKSLVAFSDPEEALLFGADDGTLCVASRDGVAPTGKTLAEVLWSWLAGEQTWGLPTASELTETDDIPPFAIPIWDESRPSEIAWAFVRGAAANRAERWGALRGVLGPHVRCARVSRGETHQERVYLDALELEILFDAHDEQSGLEQIHLRYYVDRKPEAKALLDRMLTAAAMTLVRVDGPRGPLPW